MTKMGDKFSLFLRMIQPKFLKKGDTVAIVSTARKITSEEIQPAIELLNSWGLKVVLGKTLKLESNQFAGTDKERAADFQNMLDNSEIDAIWCARGGYGTVKIIDLLDFSSFLKNLKWIIGYSDITVLHSHVHNLGVQTLHATMPIDLPKTTENSKNSLKNAVFGVKTDLNTPFSKNNKLGKTKGILIGGNLSILYSLLGSESSIDTKGKILFIEDLDEYLYHIDRMIVALKRNGYFKNLKGLIVGGMTKMHDNAIPYGKTAEEIILEQVKEFDFPVCFNFPAGHVDDNRALLLGSEIALEVNETETILTTIN